MNPVLVGVDRFYSTSYDATVFEFDHKVALVAVAGAPVPRIRTLRRRRRSLAALQLRTRHREWRDRDGDGGSSLSHRPSDGGWKARRAGGAGVSAVESQPPRSCASTPLA